MANLKVHRCDFLLTAAGLVGLLLDLILDVFTAVDFHRDRDYVRLGVFVLFLVVSSLLAQSYSWLWYSYEDFDMCTNVEKVPSVRSLWILHVLQLGTYLRHMGVMEMAICKYLALKLESPNDPGDVAVFLSHDVAMLRIVETFSESLPHLILMVTTYIQRGQLDTFPVLKAIVSVLFISFTVMSYHRSLRLFLKDKHQQTVVSSGVYFLWNFLLIAARVVALALFSSELPCYIAAHFLCSWTVLFITAWCCQTDFMNCKGGEVLYRATVALIWYFSWFNVVEGNTLWRTALYHGYILLDVTLLCGLWFWKINPDLTNFNYKHLIVYLCILSVYMMGLFVKLIYYKILHPNVTKEDLKSEDEETELDSPDRDQDVVDFAFRSLNIEADDRTTRREPEKKMNKRMRKLAENFYN